jgi:hypothetical protein
MDAAEAATSSPSQAPPAALAYLPPRQPSDPCQARLEAAGPCTHLQRAARSGPAEHAASTRSYAVARESGARDSVAHAGRGAALWRTKGGSGGGTCGNSALTSSRARTAGACSKPCIACSQPASPGRPDQRCARAPGVPDPPTLPPRRNGGVGDGGKRPTADGPQRRMAARAESESPRGM